MKNIEKYTDTRSALGAWNRYHDGGGAAPFTAWAEQEYDEPRVLTLLEAAEAVADEWRTMDTEPNVRHGKIADLENAIAREKAKPVRNFDRYKTAKEAYAGFRKFCDGIYDCEKCRFKDCDGAYGSPTSHGCMLAWFYEEAEKEETGKEEVK